MASGPRFQRPELLSTFRHTESHDMPSVFFASSWQGMQQHRMRIPDSSAWRGRGNLRVFGTMCGARSKEEYRSSRQAMNSAWPMLSPVVSQFADGYNAEGGFSVPWTSSHIEASEWGRLLLKQPPPKKNHWNYQQPVQA